MDGVGRPDLAQRCASKSTPLLPVRDTLSRSARRSAECVAQARTPRAVPSEHLITLNAQLTVGAQPSAGKQGGRRQTWHGPGPGGPRPGRTGAAVPRGTSRPSATASHCRTARCRQSGCSASFALQTNCCPRSIGSLGLRLPTVPMRDGRVEVCNARGIRSSAYER
jgi:hypothetical protein